MEYCNYRGRIMIKKKKTKIKEHYILQPEFFKDERGQFIKTFHDEMYKELGIPTIWKEEYCSTSQHKVLRGLHFQLPPHEHAKLIYCAYGKILDVVVDLRKTSATFGQYEMTELSSENGRISYVPVGCAHGFYTMSDIAVIVCKQSTVFHPESDAGIRWDSVGIPWQDQHPILSEKDKSQIAFSQFRSPF